MSETTKATRFDMPPGVVSVVLTKEGAMRETTKGRSDTIRKMADEAKIDYFAGLLPINAKFRLDAASNEMLASIAAEEEHRAYAYARIAARAARRARRTR